jgi:phosphoribosylformylglycinamidine synthase
MQDLGAAGLTSATIECASRGGVGAEVDVALVPRRETGMTPYEVMLSESQERMLLVVRPESLARVREVVVRWSLQATAIGHITDDGMVRVRDGEEIVAAVPAGYFTDRCPSYVRPAAEAASIVAARACDLSEIPDIESEQIGEVLLDLLGSPNIGSRRPVFERYDQTILTNTVVPPGEADAAVLRLKDTGRAIAAAIDCNSRYCFLDPELGGRHAVAEATRNVACVGATPLAVTNCLNFGNPEKPSGYFQLDRAVAGMATACAALGVPVVSGNVSLYNETADTAVMPTPAVGAVGVRERGERHATMRWRAGDVVLLVGDGRPTIGGSEYLAVRHGRIAGAPPALDLDLELRVQTIVRSAVADGLVQTAHDCSAGGLAVALAEMAIVSGVGVTITAADLPNGAGRSDERWFGEAPSRVVIASPASDARIVEERCAAAAVPVTRLGEVGGEAIAIAPAIRVSLAEARGRYEGALIGLS